MRALPLVKFTAQPGAPVNLDKRSQCAALRRHGQQWDFLDRNPEAPPHDGLTRDRNIN
jgi:hypothetical protein